MRRAAAAALQVHVGRHGLVPHGIDLITAADYFSVGNREHAFLVVAREVGQYAEYGEVRGTCVVFYCFAVRSAPTASSTCSAMNFARAFVAHARVAVARVCAAARLTLKYHTCRRRS